MWLVNIRIVIYLCLGLSNVLLIFTGQNTGQKVILQAPEILDVVLEDVGSYSQPTSSKLLHEVRVLYLKLHSKPEYMTNKKPHLAFGIFEFYK